MYCIHSFIHSVLWCCAFSRLNFTFFFIASREECNLKHMNLYHIDMYVFINIEYGAMMRTMQQLYNDNSTIKKIYMLNQHNLLWICCQSLCSIKREFLQIMATTTTPTPITIDPRRISRRFQKKAICFRRHFLQFVLCCSFYVPGSFVVVFF